MGRVDHVVTVVGPTGVGKSDLAIELAVRLGGEVISTDAYQVYRDMDVGTAKTPVADRRGVPHHLVDVLDVTEAASVAQFQTAARRAVDDCRTRGVVPVVVGGSSLYVRAVLDDLDFPGTDPAVRALEVVELTGQPFRAHMPPYASVIGPVAIVGLTADREVLDARLAARVDAMWEAGLVDEVRALAARGLAESPTASRALGYAEVLDLLAGRVDEQEARDRTVLGTQRFARRQRRLFGKDPRVTWLPHDAPDLVDRALAALHTGAA